LLFGHCATFACEPAQGLFVDDAHHLACMETFFTCWPLEASAGREEARTESGNRRILGGCDNKAFVGSMASTEAFRAACCARVLAVIAEVASCAASSAAQG
jgi:hypothetical protein